MNVGSSVNRDWDRIATVLCTSSSTTIKRYLAGGVDAVLDAPHSALSAFWVAMVTMVIRWVNARRDYGFVGSRWICSAVAMLLREDCGACANTISSTADRGRCSDQKAPSAPETQEDPNLAPPPARW